MANGASEETLLENLKEQLRFSRTGRFYKLTSALNKKRLQTLIGGISIAHADSSAVALSGLGAPHAQILRSKDMGPWNVDGATIQAFGTLYVQPVLVPSSLATPGAPLKELRFAHVLILEGAVKSGRSVGQRYAFVNREVLPDPLIDLAQAKPLGRAELLNPFLCSSLLNAETGRIEELSMRMMNVSRVGMRRKVVEAYDVESSVSSFGLHRTIPGTMRIRLPRTAGVGTAVTVSPGRHAVRAGSSKVKLSTVTQWFAQCVVRLNAENGKSALGNKFLSQMAEPLPTLDGLEPGSLLLDYAAIEEAGLRDSMTWERAKKTPIGWTDDSHVIAAFDEPVVLTESPRSPRSGVRTYEGLIDDGNGSKIKIEIEIEGSHCRLVPSRHEQLGSIKESTGESIPFEQLVNRANALRIAFDGGKVLYASEGAHRSGNLRLAVQHLLSRMVEVSSLGGVTSEKGTVSPKDKKFQPDSCFHFIEIEPTITHPESTLVCGDATDEIFDYLEINEPEKLLRWLHAKVEQKKDKDDKPVSAAMRSGSLSASNLQEVVGQAIKNLAFLRRDSSDPTFAAETARWGEHCTLPEKAKIPRLRRGKDPHTKLRTISAAPTARHEVAIVIPAYSKKTLADEFSRIESGSAEQHSIQLFWLLSGFTHSCLEVGVTPLIFVR